MYLGKSAGLSSEEMDEMTFADLLSYVGFLAAVRSSTKEASQSDIDTLAI